MKAITIILLFISPAVFSRHYQLKKITTNTDASFRAISVVNNYVAWVSGTNGTVGKSTDGGNNWEFVQVKRYEKCDFRSLYAFDKNTAIIANAGVPAVILRTTNGGKDWTLVYKNDDTAAFFDGIDFADKKHGVIYGDPINGKLMLLHTSNSGKTWEDIQDGHFPRLVEGEASFAASGTCIRYLKNGRMIIATGGKASHLQFSDDNGLNWRQVATPIIQGTNSTGIFSFAFNKYGHGIIVGGDYKQDTLTYLNSFYSKDGGMTWKAPQTPVRGYRECVQYLTLRTAIALGPAGIDISFNSGEKWAPFSDEKAFHAARKSRKGNLVILAGAKGEIGILKASHH